MSEYIIPTDPHYPTSAINPGFTVRERSSFKSAGAFEPFSRVVLTVSDEVEYVSGDETGRTLYAECPWGTQMIADGILHGIQGYTYMPYTSKGALIAPHAEVADTVTFTWPNSNSPLITSSICSMDISYGRIFKADISAPAEEEIDHEYPYVPRSERAIVRKMEKMSSEFKVQADSISAKVSKAGGNESFSWELDEKSWVLKSKDANVLKAYEEGVEITGKIIATSGKIGGFNILQDHLSYNGQTWMGEVVLGAYIGMNGIQLGKNFRVDMAGNLYAASGEFSGTVKAGNIQFGEENGGFLSGAALSLDSVKTNVLASGIRTSLGYANFANQVFSGYKHCEHMGAKRMHLGDYDMGWMIVNYLDHNGNKRSLRVIVGQ